LHHVLGILQRPDHPVAMHVQLTSVLIDDLGEGGFVAGANRRFYV
jgi:hypothetical protein